MAAIAGYVALLGIPAGIVLYTVGTYGAIFTRRGHWHVVELAGAWILSAGFLGLGIFGMRHIEGTMDALMAGMALTGGFIALACSCVETVRRLTEFRVWMRSSEASGRR